MSQFAYYTTLRRLKNSNGVIGSLPRIYNVDRNTYTYGYASVNVAAASPFVRTKVHEGRFEGKTDIQDGDLILDRYDNSHYLVMSTKGIYGGGKDGQTAYYDATLYLTNATATVRRLGITRDPFYRQIEGFVDVATNVKIMTNPQNFSVNEQPGQVLQENKIKVVLQSKVGVQLHDRLVTDLSDTLIIENIDKSSIRNLWICMCNFDVR